MKEALKRRNLSKKPSTYRDVSTDSDVSETAAPTSPTSLSSGHGTGSVGLQVWNLMFPESRFELPESSFL